MKKLFLLPIILFIMSCEKDDCECRFIDNRFGETFYALNCSGEYEYTSNADLLEAMRHCL